MPDTDLIVPVRLHTLVVTQQLGEHEFTRWTPDFSIMLNEAKSPEPPFHREVTDLDGVHIQWELPEALARGHYDAITGETTFPLVPNRWLMVRYYNRDGARQAKGWVVHSDYLPVSDYGHDWTEGNSWYLTDRSPDGQTVDPHQDTIGRHHELTVTDPWTEPARREPFLTAVGPGLPAFAAFASYHMDVFCFHDTLKDLQQGSGYHYAPDNDLSYAVIGWYADPGADILQRARDIPGLLPPQPGNLDQPDTSMEAVLRALGWSAPGDTSGLTDSRYYGTALHVPWRYKDPAPRSRKPTNDKVKLAVGHSTADAAAQLVSRHTRSEDSGELVKALFNGTIETYGLPDGAVELDEATRRAWYAGSEGGHLWQIVPDPAHDHDASDQVPEIPDWLDELNLDQAEYDETADRLARTRARLWDVWWLKNLPVDGNGAHPGGFDDEAQRQLTPGIAGTLAAQVKVDLDRLATLREGEGNTPGLPVGNTPEELEERIVAYALARELPQELQLKRVARDPYHSPADPVVVIEGSGASQPLGRDTEDPLPCRLPSVLLESIKINGAPTSPDPAAPKPNLVNLPPVCATLIAEFALLDKAAWTLAGPDVTALEVALGDPESTVTGALPEYTGMWEQPWTPMYLQWDIKYCATPFRTDTTDNWTFDGTTYSWNGTNALSLGGDEHLWPRFQGRSFLAPTTAYVLKEQAKRYLNTFSPAETQGLAGLLDYYAELDVLSQTLDGFNDWLLEQDGTARLTPSKEDADPALFGDPLQVPQPGPPNQPDQNRFQPVRAGQFSFNKLLMIDRFGRTFDFMALNSSDPASMQPRPLKARSVRPDPTKPLYTTPELPKPNDDWRFIQLPPRLMQPARVRLEPVRSKDGIAYPGLPPAGDPEQTPVVGWLMLNHLDRTLLVYAPDGAPLGELRVVGEGARLAWTMLPHAAYRRPSDQGFRDDFPQLSEMLTALLDHADAPGAFEALVHTIDQTFQSISDESPETDRSPARLIGRPVALIRAELEVQLQGPPLSSPAWGKILDPSGRAEYLSYRWPVRLGSPELLTDGLIGYYASLQGPGGATDYSPLSVVAKDLATHPYLTPVTNGTDLALPATPSDAPPVVHHLTLLADPHAAIHATTDILPVAELALNADLVQRALARIEASFRLDPLLAPTRAGDQTAAASPALGEASGHHLAHLLDGNLGSHYLSEQPAAAGDWIEIDLAGAEHAEVEVTRVDIYPGDTTGGHSLPACTLETFTETAGWTERATYPAGTEIHYNPAPPVTAARIRIRFTAPTTAPIAIRSFTATTDVGDNGLVMPRPAAWFGDWTWAEPHARDTGVPDWARLPLLPADRSAYLDDAVPTARAGYLQLRPRHD
ncbi:discoidin domain-containing protein [Streptomyces caniferus]|uniref:Discoidin domain-containing protein n=1 Tax=Streptomyces caniferus TaxID=285557 RepID=A0ABZ1VGU6_9ACTN|nr:discoidin domain-containing protein [Streptomyces caniferus]